MANFALLNSVDHQHLRIITQRSARYGDGVMQALTFPFEFRNVQAHYPILFHQDGEGALQPVALFGFQQRENLFLDAHGWNAAYIPAMVRREPFLIGWQRAEGGERERALSIDLDHPRVNAETGELLFQPFGGHTPFLEAAANLLEAIHDGVQHGKAFVAALQEHDLLEPVTLEVALRDGSRNQLIGFHGLNEEKLQALPGTVLGELGKNGFLMPAFMALASMSNFQRLVEKKDQTLQTQAAHELAS